MIERGVCLESVAGVAAQLGHAPSMTLSSYAHVMADLDEDDRRSAEDLIREANQEIYGAPPDCYRRRQRQKGSDAEGALS